MSPLLDKQELGLGMFIVTYQLPKTQPFLDRLHLRARATV